MSANSTMYTAASGLDSFTKAISVVSDNIANANTIGFKANEILFADMVGASYSTLAGTANRAGTGTTLLTMRTDFTQGPVMSTSNWSDLAINGEGYFVVIPPGATDVSSVTNYYTRDGSFRMDKDGYLVNSQGYRVVSTDGTPIQIEADPNNPVYIDYYVGSDGKIYGVKGGDSPPEVIATIRLVRFPDEVGLIRRGGNLFVRGPYTGDPIEGVGGQDGMGEILDRSLENSNVDMTRELVNMIVYQADFNANSKTITVGKQMFDTITNLIR